MKVLITGSSGYVGSELCSRMEASTYIGIDLRSGLYTTVVADIKELSQAEIDLSDVNKVIHLAAARNDFGLDAKAYYEHNVKATREFLTWLSGADLDVFVHVSSVASFDGEIIDFEPTLKEDNAYRSTKFLQEKLIRDWCRSKDILLAVIYPSAIYDADYRGDTNIGRIIRAVEKFPFIPAIDVKKSLTPLSGLCDFINHAASGAVPSGNYLCIEDPVLSVTDILRRQYPFKRVIKIWGFRYILLSMSMICEKFGFAAFLNRNRVKKLYKQTVYAELKIDRTSFSSLIEK